MLMILHPNKATKQDFISSVQLTYNGLYRWAKVDWK